jgi:hypothetical protein
LLNLGSDPEAKDVLSRSILEVLDHFIAPNSALQDVKTYRLNLKIHKMITDYTKGEYVKNQAKYRDVIFLDSIKPKNKRLDIENKLK